jgi:tRNA (guanine-N(7)-)-methyltransferase subunit TRM82
LSFYADSNLPKRLASITFSPDGSSLLAADRIGDVYLLTLPQFPVPHIAAPTKIDVPDDKPPLLGHFSTVTDIAVTHDRVATSDRDNRVRVSHFPSAVNIQSMCLGHTDFVTRVCWVSSSRLLSAGGDGVARLWCPETGTELSSVAISDLTPDNPTAGVIVSLSCSGDIAAAIVHGCPRVVIVAGLTSEKLRVAGSFGLCRSQNDAYSLPTAGEFDSFGRLWVSATESATVCAYDLSSKVDFGEDAVLDAAAMVTIGGGVDGLETTSHWLSGLRKKEFVDAWKGKKRRRNGESDDGKDDDDS